MSVAICCEIDRKVKRLPCLFDGTFEDVSGGVDEDIETAYFLVQVRDDRLELFEVVGDVEICCDGAFVLEVFEFG